MPLTEVINQRSQNLKAMELEKKVLELVVMFKIENNSDELSDVLKKNIIKLSEFIV